MAQSGAQIPLWRQLQSVAAVIQSIRAGVSGTAAIERVPVELRPGVQALSFQVLRGLGRAQALRQLLANRAPSAPADALLCTALALVWSETDAPYEAFTLVNQTVEAAKRTPTTKAQANFINGCLRRFLREREQLVAHTDSNPVAVWNHPQWWIDRVKKEQPEHWQAILKANNQQAAMTLRVNCRQSSVSDYLNQLKSLGLEGVASGESGVTLSQAKPVHVLPGFSSGMVSVQDTAAQMAAPLLLAGLQPMGSALRVLDACAAPGGKTAHLLEYADCDVTALDMDAARCERIHQTLARLGLEARVRVSDAVDTAQWWDGQLFDAILLDAPCSASGIVRRHPDVRWLRRETDIAQLAQIQARLLKTLWPLVRPGGRLLYCTCSVFQAEGAGQIKTFLAHHNDASLLPSPGHLMPRHRQNEEQVLDNRLTDHDGFYYALLEKRAS
ncbi:MAG: 16S rRNA (cytosine(967)-C(5))-methyltransferase RsmB [Rhodoferax sp.]|nr:16S rRNA (cytosine(967)-C(5))-methyltransferase RsmB [Rhodoferax sp.]